MASGTGDEPVEANASQPPPEADIPLQESEHKKKKKKKHKHKDDTDETTNKSSKKHRKHKKHSKDKSADSHIHNSDKVELLPEPPAVGSSTRSLAENQHNSSQRKITESKSSLNEKQPSVKQLASSRNGSIRELGSKAVSRTSFAVDGSNLNSVKGSHDDFMNNPSRGNSLQKLDKSNSSAPINHMSNQSIQNIINDHHHSSQNLSSPRDSNHLADHQMSHQSLDNSKHDTRDLATEEPDIKEESTSNHDQNNEESNHDMKNADTRTLGSGFNNLESDEPINASMEIIENTSNNDQEEQSYESDNQTRDVKNKPVWRPAGIAPPRPPYTPKPSQPKKQQKADANHSQTHYQEPPHSDTSSSDDDDEAYQNSKGSKKTVQYEDWDIPDNAPSDSAESVPNEVIKCRLDDYTILKMWDEEDYACCDYVYRWREANPNATLDDALAYFCTKFRSADVLIPIIYRVNQWDWILRYKAKEEEDILHQARESFEKHLVKSGLILEIEQSPDYADIYFVKIIAPFHVLCSEAQKILLRIEKNTSDEAAPTDFFIEEHQGCLYNLFSKMVYHLDLNVQSKVIDDDISNFKFKYYDAIGREAYVNTVGYPAHVVRTRFFSRRQRLMIVDNMIRSNSIFVRLKKGYKKEGIEFLLSKNVYIDTYATHDSLRGANVNGFDLMSSRDNLHISEEKKSGSAFMRLNSKNDTTGQLKKKDKKIHPESSQDQDQILNTTNLRARLLVQWVKGKKTDSDPFEDMREYFGEKVAFYFIFLDYYGTWLIASSIFGVIVFLYGLSVLFNAPVSDYRWIYMFDNTLTPYFAFFMALWSVVYSEFWKRRVSFYAMKWHVYDYNAEEKPRLEFRSHSYVRSPITRKMEYHFPKSIRLGRQIVSFFVCLFFVGLVILTLIAQIVLLAYLISKKIEKLWADVITAIFATFCIYLMRFIFRAVAKYLTDWENYKTESHYVNAFITKTWLFEFANIYSRIIYFAFARPFITSVPFIEQSIPFNYCTKSEMCSADVSIQLLVIFLLDQFIDRLSEFVMPIILAKYRNSRAKLQKVFGDTRRHVNYQHYVDEKRSDSPDLNGDYFQKAIQYGYVTMFVSAFPLAPLFALINNLLEKRMDAYKYLKILRRATPERAQDIGCWQVVLTSTSLLAVTTNAFLIAFASSYFNNTYVYNNSSTSTQNLVRFGFIVVWHLVIYAIGYFVVYVIPNEPVEVRIALARADYLEKVAIDKWKEAVDEENEDDDRNSILNFN